MISCDFCNYISVKECHLTTRDTNALLRFRELRKFSQFESLTIIRRILRVVKNIKSLFPKTNCMRYKYGVEKRTKNYRFSIKLNSNQTEHTTSSFHITVWTLSKKTSCLIFLSLRNVLELHGIILLFVTAFFLF